MNTARKIIPFFLVAIISLFLGYKTKQIISPEKNDTNEEIVFEMEALPVPSSQPRNMPNDQFIYESHCAACHDTGAAGAPKSGDKRVWAPRIAKGIATLLQHVSQGYNLMPPKGACVECSDMDLELATNYLIKK